MTSQRDVLISSIYTIAKRDSNVFFVTVDFGAPSLDIFRETLPNQFIHAGISEQNAIDLAAGLSLSGNKVFVYGMAPFISLRCLEQIKTSLCQMKLPVSIISVGVGLGYADSGPTHYATEDLGALRSLVNIEIYDISSSRMSEVAAAELCRNEGGCPRFLRLDREILSEPHDNFNASDWRKGYKFINQVNSPVLVVASGKSLAIARSALDSLSFSFDCVDLFRRKPLPPSFANSLESYEKVIFLDEQTTDSCSFGHLLQGLHMIDPMLLKSKAFVTLDLGERYFYENGGRQYLHDLVRFNSTELVRKVLS